jgi:hypothetical protein
MIPFEELKNRLQNSDIIKNPLKRPLWIVAILTEALKTIGERPILVGGEALEYYTSDGYTTGGIDIVLPSTNEVNTIFSKLGFHKEGRYWIREDIDVLIEAPASDLAGENTPLVEVEIEDMRCYIIGFEDMIIDRLDSYIHLHWEDARRWVKGLLSLHGQDINKKYLFSKAREHSSEQALIKIFQELKEDKGNHLR